MSDDIARMLYDGAVAITEGRKDDAQTLLMAVVQRDEDNEQGWLWLSGAVDDPADQQVALENVLAINPYNQAAQDGLRWLQQQAGAAPFAAPADWTPPPPSDPEEVLELTCSKCGAALYSVAQFCWQCHAPVHSCNNCTLLPEMRCKELQGLTSTMAQATQNTCPWWRPHQ